MDSRETDADIRSESKTKAVVLAFAILATRAAAFAAAPQWSNFAGDAQHTADSAVASDSLSSIRWQTPVDLDPQYSGSELFIHYGSPLVMATNNVIVPVKTGAFGGFEIEGLSGSTGSTLWSASTDYTLPPHDWTPSYAPALTPTTRLYYAGNGGTIYYRDNADTASPTIAIQTAFYGLANYTTDPTAYNSTVFINTPITSDAAGDIFLDFEYQAQPPPARDCPAMAVELPGSAQTARLVSLQQPSLRETAPSRTM